MTAGGLVVVLTAGALLAGPAVAAGAGPTGVYQNGPTAAPAFAAREDGPPVPDANELRRIAEDIVSQPAYTGEYESVWQQWLYNNPVTDWLREMWQRFTRWLAERFSFGGESDATDPGVVDPNRSAYGLPLVVATVVGALFVAWRLARREAFDDESVLEWFEAVPEALRSRAALADAASAAAMRGEHREAIRFRFLAGLLALDESGRIELRPQSRMHQLRFAVDDVHFDQAAGLFERAVYSTHEPTGDDTAAHQAAWTNLLGVGVDA